MAALNTISDSAFTIETPACESIRPAFDVTQAKIMLVDDEPINIMAAEKYLRGVGYHNLLHTTQSTEALNMIQRERPDLVLLDIMMPQVNGLDLLRQIRADARLQFMPVLILTAHCDAETKHEALQSGATDFLGKPVDPHELAPRVRNVLIVKARQDQLEGEVYRQAEQLVAAKHDAKLHYLAGKAELATDVLHNVGNALNSVNVALSCVEESVRESKISLLERAARLLQENEANLAQFLSSDPRGQLLPSYFRDLTNSLVAEQKTISQELEVADKHLDHIRSVVATQQKYAAFRNAHEELRLADVLQDAEELIIAPAACHGIELIRSYTDVPIKSDRQKLLQVVLNLIKNAVQAIQQDESLDIGQLEIACGTRDEQCAFVKVKDNGIGISKEHLPRIFTHGFTTKKDGHGFGLHSCANLIEELGGSIRAQSDGIGRGATFTLELPFKFERRNA